MKITTFGSCRQHPISKYFEVSNIQESLTYPHYTKEILQAIRYCKCEQDIPPEITKVCFRTGLLTKSAISVEQLYYDFHTTDFFVIEIASRLCYEWNGYYMHHIAEEAQYFTNHKDVQVRELTDQEIEQDLLEIRDALAPKPFLVVSHIATYESGKRKQLVDLLQTLTNKYSIPFLNPACLLKFHTVEQLFVPEKVLAHYTDFGKECVAKLYKESIQKECLKGNIKE